MNTTVFVAALCAGCGIERTPSVTVTPTDSERVAVPAARSSSGGEAMRTAPSATRPVTASDLAQDDRVEDGAPLPAMPAAPALDPALAARADELDRQAAGSGNCWEPAFTFARSGSIEASDGCRVWFATLSQGGDAGAVAIARRLPRLLPPHRPADQRLGQSEVAANFATIFATTNGRVALPLLLRWLHGEASAARSDWRLRPWIQAFEQITGYPVFDRAPWSGSDAAISQDTRAAIVRALRFWERQGAVADWEPASRAQLQRWLQTRGDPARVVNAARIVLARDASIQLLSTATSALEAIVQDARASAEARETARYMLASRPAGKKKR